MNQRPAPVYLGNNTAIARTIYGDNIYVDTRDITIAPHILMDGVWEEWISNPMIDQMRSQYMFIDVGANVGWFMLLAARFGAERVLAFEPNRRLYELLSNTTISSNWSDKIELFPTALSDTEGDVTMAISHRFAGSGSCLGPQFAVHTEEQEAHKLPLDFVLDLASIKDESVMLKIDVEGYEPRVVLGATQLLRLADCTAYVEYHQDPKGETRLVEMLDFFESAGYRMSHVTKESRRSPLSREKLANIPDADMLCFSKFKQ